MEQKKYKIAKLLTLVLIILAVKTSTLTAQCTEQSTLYGSLNMISGGPRVGQSFTASCSGQLTSITYRTFPNANQAGTLSIYQGDPGGTLIATQSFSVTSAANGELTITLSSPPILNANGYYTFMIGAEPSTTVYLYIYNGDVYPGGVYWYDNGFMSYPTGSDETYFIASIVPTCPPKRSVTSLTVCPSELPYNWHGVLFNTAKTDSAYISIMPGCDSVAVLNLSLITNTVSPISVSDDRICSGDTIQLSATGTGTIGWAPNTNISSVNGNSINAYPTTTTTYSVISTVASCSVTKTFTVLVSDSVDINQHIYAQDTVLCRSGDSTFIKIPGSRIGSTYYLLNSSEDPIAVPHYGSGDTISISTGALHDAVNTFRISVANTSPKNNEISFNGINNYVSTSHQLPIYGCTVEGWVKKENWADHGDDMIFGTGINYPDQGALNVTLNPILGLQFRYGGPEFDSRITSSLSTQSFTPNSWHHIAISWDRDNMNNVTYLKLYLDGALVDQAWTNLWIGPQQLTFGGDNSGTSSNFGPGAMRTIRVWDRALTDAEITNNYDQLLPASTPNLIDLYNFKETVSTLTADEHPNGYEGTLHNYSSDAEAWSNNINNCVLSNQLVEIATVKIVPYSSAHQLSVCPSQLPYTWYGHTFTGFGSYTEDSLTAVGGCDSIAVLTLVMTPSVSASQSLTLCNGHSLTIGNHTYSTDGTYIDTL
ncbi:MAG TPA: LamG domain-containing protein, partial [Bacteroidia bacterium]